MNTLRFAGTALILLITGITLSACGESSDLAPAQQQAAAQQSAELKPADPDLAMLYDQTCRNCHTSAASGAPLTGSAADWAPRMKKGMDTLLDNTINGFRGMPPLGTCMDCSEAEFESLIRFMAEGS